jgi:hypothetical protein
MSATYKVLGQSNPAGTSSTDLYTVPGSTSAVVSTISVANLGTSGTFRLSVAPAGAAVANSQYIAYDVGLNANDAITFTLGITLAATDKIRVFASNASFAFSAFGSELT